MNKLEIAQELLKRNSHSGLIRLLEKYISNLPSIEQNNYEFDHPDFKRLHEVISYIENTELDIRGIQNPESFIGAHFVKENDLF
ncbi:hypothetical protein [Bacillus subtilis]|uniref:hypothetical protein n=1 Tax=Bacillus subtilis TaxID=1423 RepID=UPI000849EFE0|nr:hypothetical protein [Bacillus subtilis]ODV47907.1 hypothetical protein BCM26_05730 [Bacillus subtilis]OJH63505.1 hypothetical protein BOH71_09670 [Bacillus subtilis]